MRGKKIAVLKAAVCLVLMVLMCGSGYQVYQTQRQYELEELQHQTVLAYKPMEGTHTFEELPNSIQLLQDQYPDVVGWIAIPGTKLDYPFVQGEDNDQYLRANLEGDYLAAGTIFMDYRNDRELASFHTILYGHYMKNGSVFGSLASFKNGDFFQQTAVGTVYLANQTYTLEIFACVPTNDYDAMIYNVQQSNDEEKQAFLNYVQERAAQYRDIGVTTGDRLLTLSTCSYEFAGARTVVIGRLIEKLD